MLISLFSLVAFYFPLSSCSECPYNGFFCSNDCSKLFQCIMNQSIEVYSCPEGEYCNMIDRGCSSTHLSPGTCVEYNEFRIHHLFKVHSKRCNSFPHPTDCTKYFTCLIDLVKLTCPPGMIFNSTSSECDDEVSGDCEDTKGGVETPECSKEKIGQRWKIKCDTYYECRMRQRMVPCPHGTSFDPKTRQCDADLNSDVCQKGLTAKCEKAGLFRRKPLKADRSIFSVCVYDQKAYKMTLVQCDEGFVFSYKLQKCIPEEEANCGNSQTSVMLSICVLSRILLFSLLIIYFIR